MKGFIYLLTPPDCKNNPDHQGVYKIGMTEQSNPNKRLGGYSFVESPEVHLLIKVEDAPGCEAKIIERYTQKFKKWTKKEYFKGKLSNFVNEARSVAKEHDPTYSIQKLNYKTYLEDVGEEVYNFGEHHGYKLKLKDIKKFCVNWHSNRDIDETRIKEMVSIHKKGGYIPRILHFAEFEGKLQCYDGNNRREVFTRVSESEGSVECIVDIIFNATENQIKECFRYINKSVPLPSIYTGALEDENMDSVKNKIIALVDEYVEKYPTMVKSTPNPYSGHFNRDSFIDLITSYYEEFDREVSIEEIKTLLVKLNKLYSEGKMISIKSSVSKTFTEKCRLNNFWLFYVRGGPPFSHLQKIRSVK